MKEEVFAKATEYIDAIAANLGVAAEHVYRILVQQKVAEGIAGTVVGSVSIIVFIVLASLLFGAYLNPKYEVNKEFYSVKVPTNVYAKVRDLIEDENSLFAFLLPIVMIITGLVGSITLYFGILSLINPEYYAIKEILDAFGGGK